MTIVITMSRIVAHCPQWLNPFCIVERRYPSFRSHVLKYLPRSWEPSRQLNFLLGSFDDRYNESHLLIQAILVSIHCKRSLFTSLFHQLAGWIDRSSPLRRVRKAVSLFKVSDEKIRPLSVFFILLCHVL